MITRLFLLIFLSGSILATELNDPTAPGWMIGAQQQVKKTKPPLKLSAVLYANDRKIAVISGQKLQVGDQIRGYRVIRIGAREVELLKSDRKLLLQLKDYSSIVSKEMVKP